MKKIFNFITSPFRLIKKIFNFITEKIKNKKIETKELIPLEKELERWFDKYGDNIQFKLSLGEKENQLEIYSKNYKIGLEKAKKAKKEEKEKESNVND